MNNEINEMEYFNFNLIPGQERCKREIKFNSKVSISIITEATKEIKEEQVNSLLNQTFPYWEWVIYNKSGSKEISEQIKNLGNKDNRIKLGDKNKKTLFEMVEAADNEVVMILSEEDLPDRTMLDVGYWGMVREKARNIAFSYTNTVCIGKKQELINELFVFKKLLTKRLIPNTLIVKKSEFIESLKGKELSDRDYGIEIFLEFAKQGKAIQKFNFYGIWHNNSLDSEISDKIKNDIKSNMKLYNKKLNITEFPSSCDYNYGSIPTGFDWDNESINTKGTKKRLLVVIPWLTVGGADKFSIDLISRLSRDKYDISVVLTEPSLYIWRSRLEECTDEIFDVSTFLRREDFAGFIHYLVKSRNIDLIFTSSSIYFYHAIPWIKCEFPDVPIVDYLHAEDWAWRNGGYPQDSIAVSEYLDKTYTCTNYLKTLMGERMGANTENIKPVYIGVDGNKFNPDIVDETKISEYDELKDKKCIAFVCRISNEKRPLLMARIAARICEKRKDIVFLVIGDGMVRAETEELVKTLGIQDNVKFLGMRSNVAEYYKFCKASLICSISEGLALTTYESLALGTPVITADVGGQKELVNDTCGKVIRKYQISGVDTFNHNYSQEEIDDYAKAITDIIDNPQYEKMREDCIERISSEFTCDHMADVLDNEFEEIIKNGTRISKDILATRRLASRYLVLHNEIDKRFYGRPRSWRDTKLGRITIIRWLLEIFVFTGIPQVMFYVARKVARLMGINIRNVTAGELAMQIPWLRWIINCFKPKNKRK